MNYSELLKKCGDTSEIIEPPMYKFLCDQFIKGEIIKTDNNTLSLDYMYENFSLWHKRCFNTNVPTKSEIKSDLIKCLNQQFTFNCLNNDIAWYGIGLKVNLDDIYNKFINENLCTVLDRAAVVHSNLMHSRFVSWFEKTFKTSKIPDRETIETNLRLKIRLQHDGYWHGVQLVNKSSGKSSDLIDFIKADNELREAIIKRNNEFYKCINNRKIIDKEFVSKNMIDHPGSQPIIDRLNKST